MNYLLIKATYSNGFPVYSGEEFSKISEVMASFTKYCSAAKLEYPNGIISEKHIENISFSDTFCIFDDAPTGNGYFIGIICEVDAINAIETMVDLSKDTNQFFHLGFGEDDPDYKMSCPMVNIDTAAIIEIDGTGTISDDFEHCRLNYIVRHPYDPTQPNSDEYVYNVNVTGWHDDENECFEYMDCIENIDWIVFYNIIGELFIH